MDHRILSAAARPVARTAAMLTAISLVAALPVSPAFAQKQTKPAAAAPAKGQQAAQQGEVHMPQLLYSEWTKFCITPGQQNGAESKNANDKNAKNAKDAKNDAGKEKICLTGIDGRLESGQPVVALVAIDPTGPGNHVLRVTLPVGMHLQHGTRLIIGKDNPLTAPYVTCFVNGCISDYQLTPEILAKLKKAPDVVVQGINYDGSAISVPVPLKDFAKAHDGPPADPKVLAAMEKKREEALKKKAEELKAQADAARKKLQQNQPAKK
jgi:invasion protein IalB